MIISEIQSEIRHCSCDSAKFKAPADFSHHAILLYDIVLNKTVSKTRHAEQMVVTADPGIVHSIPSYFCGD